MVDFTGGGVMKAADVELLIGAWGPWPVLFALSTGGLIVVGDGPAPVDDWSSDPDASPCTATTQSCLKPGPDPGCGDAGCCNFVCSWDTYCCEVQWDRECADYAIESGACGPVGDPAGPDPDTVG